MIIRQRPREPIDNVTGLCFGKDGKDSIKDSIEHKVIQCRLMNCILKSTVHRPALKLNTVAVTKRHADN